MIPIKFIIFVAILTLSGIECISINDAILEDMIPRDLQGAAGSTCNDPGDTTFRYKDEINFADTASRWKSYNAPYEADTFLAEMQLPSSNDNQTLTLRFGKGGNAYSIYGKFGEAIPPQGLEWGPFMDEVLQTVSVDQAYFNLTSFTTEYYIHQAGAYLYRQEKEARPTGIPPPFYSPSLGYKCIANECSFMSWGQQAHIPISYRSDVMYFHRYKNCGSGVVEYTQVMQFSGTPSTTSTSDRVHFYMNTPWTGIRTSALPDLMFSNIDGTLRDKVLNMQQWGSNPVTDSATTGGYTTFSIVGKTPSGLVLPVPCVEKSSAGTGVDCSTPLSLKLKYVANGSCIANFKDDRYQMRCTWPQNPHIPEFSALALMRGCGLCDGPMKITQLSDPTKSVDVTYIQDFHRNGYVIFETAVCTAANSCPGGHQAAVNAVNSLFSGEVDFSYAEVEPPYTWDESPSLSFIHGKGWNPSYTVKKAQDLQYGQGGGLVRRDMTVFTLDTNAKLYPGESFVSRQYLLSDIGGEAESRAFELSTEVFSTQVDNASRNSHSPYGGRKIQIYANSVTKTFGVVPASQQGGQTTSCDTTATTSPCEGITVPKDNNGNVYALRPYFYITCGVETYFGTDQYHFTPDHADGRLEPNLCKNTGDTTIRPTWIFLGFFPPDNTGCTELETYAYDTEFCMQQPSSQPSNIPSKSSAPSLLPTDIPSKDPSDKPTVFQHPSSRPSREDLNPPSLIPSTLPSNIPSKDPSDIPSLDPSNIPSSQPSLLPSDILSKDPSDIPSKDPSDIPSLDPSNIPSWQPSLLPSDIPSLDPSNIPSWQPSFLPSDIPSKDPSFKPSRSQWPSLDPSNIPSSQPSLLPSNVPSRGQSGEPTLTSSPSTSPTVAEIISGNSNGAAIIKSVMRTPKPPDFDCTKPELSIIENNVKSKVLSNLNQTSTISVRNTLINVKVYCQPDTLSSRRLQSTNSIVIEVVTRTIKNPDLTPAPTPSPVIPPLGTIQSPTQAPTSPVSFTFADLKAIVKDATVDAVKLTIPSAVVSDPVMQVVTTETPSVSPSETLQLPTPGYTPKKKKSKKNKDPKKPKKSKEPKVSKDLELKRIKKPKRNFDSELDVKSTKADKLN